MTRLHRTFVLAPALAIALFGHASIASAPAGRYTIAGGTVTDTKTGLVWQQTASTSKYPWTSSSATTASAYCAALSLNGTKPWRVPSLKELMTIVDLTQKSPAIDGAAFPSTPADFFWSATPTLGFSGQIYWTVQFDTGISDGTTVAAVNPAYVRCVR